MRKLLVLMVAVIAAGLSAAETTWHRIAIDDFGNEGKQPHLVLSDGDYEFHAPELSKTVRTVAYGNTIKVIYKDIDPVALYRLKLQFTTDSVRRQSVVINGQTLKKQFSLVEDKLTEVMLDIPQALANNGTIIAVIEKHVGGNAVLSYAELQSSMKQTVAAVTRQKKKAVAKRKQKAPSVKFDYSMIPPILPPRLSPRPTAVTGITSNSLSLNGTWKFTPKAPADMTAAIDASDWAAITVPGEWVMQGFHVPERQAAGYFRTFDVPAHWKGNRVKLRFNAVYSESSVYVNGKKAGGHLGGFTAFELDVTDFVVFGAVNTLSLSVINESVADSLASGSKYACHPLGGIPRSVTLFALPEVNVRSLIVRTAFDSEFKDATLTVIAELSNESAIMAKEGALEFELKEWKHTGDGAKLAISDRDSRFSELKSGDTQEVKLISRVKAPKKWTCETPNLYVLTTRLRVNGVEREVIETRFGFRDIEVKGADILVNGMPITLRGINRHEVYPVTGRSVPKAMYRKDIELFREANVNLIRTCHYQPDELLVEAADELGMFIECEGPYCWAHAARADASIIAEATVRQNLEMVTLLRNHPSILFWSLGNESKWNDYFAESARTVAEADPTRPTCFDTWVGNGNDICKIGTKHYPGQKKTYGSGDYPKQLGEYCHLNAYNRYELATDQALRVKWGIYLHQMWETVYKDPTCAGGSIWSGIDDTFYWDFKHPDGTIEERTVGYGTWGPIDGWRRPKPEYWGMKKSYSPVRLQMSDVRVEGERVVIPVENRQDFSNLNRLKISWMLGKASGTVTADVAPRGNGELVIPVKAKAGSTLELVVDDPRGFNVDRFKLPIGDGVPAKSTSDAKTAYTVNKTADAITVKGAQTTYTISLKTGLIITENVKGPYLMILPLNGGGNTQMHGPTKLYEPYTHTCSNWSLDSVTHTQANGMPVITVTGSYKEATGAFIYRFNADGTFTVDYDFEVADKVNPRQLGIVFELPKSYENLSWKRKGYWSTYPDWHIARLEGSAKASEGYDSTPVGHRTKPNHEWRHDRTAIGSNDFASTKHNVYTASLMSDAGKGLGVLANADRHVRAWNEDGKIRLLIAYYSNGGKERFLGRLVARDYRKLKKGNRVTSSATLQVNP